MVMVSGEVIGSVLFIYHPYKNHQITRSRHHSELYICCTTVGMEKILYLSACMIRAMDVL